MNIAQRFKEEGKEEGKIEGKEEGKIEIALNLLARGLELPFIADVTGLSRTRLIELSPS